MRRLLVALAAAVLPGLAAAQVPTAFHELKPGSPISSAAVDAAFAQALNAARLGQPGGAADLDATGHLPVARMPPYVTDFGGRTGSVALNPGDFQAAFGSVPAGRVLAAPVGGGLPTFRPLAPGDLPVTPTSWQPALSYDPVLAGAEQAWRDLYGNLWRNASSSGVPRLILTNGIGWPDDAQDLTPWVMAQATNAIYWRWKIWGYAPAAEMLRSQFSFFRSKYDAALTSSTGGAVRIPFCNFNDDCDWTMQFLQQVHEATGDPKALEYLITVSDARQAKYADPNGSGAGMVYQTYADAVAASGSPSGSYGGKSSTYEVVGAVADLYAYEATGYGNLLQRAMGTWSWAHAYARHSTGVYFAEVDIRPCTNQYDGKDGIHPAGTCPLDANGNLTAPNGNYRRGYGYDGAIGCLACHGGRLFPGGTFAMAALSARLYVVTGQQQYRDEVNAIVAGLQRTDTFMRPGAPVGVAGNVLQSTRDGWVEGNTAPRMAWDALALAGVDADGGLKALLRNTATGIYGQRTAQGWYGADWAGPEVNSEGGMVTWQGLGLGQCGNTPGPSCGQSIAQQMNTTGQTVSMMFAGALVAKWGQRR